MTVIGEISAEVGTLAVMSQANENKVYLDCWYKVPTPELMAKTGHPTR